MTPTATRVIYPELPDPLTPGDLQQLFNVKEPSRQASEALTQPSHRQEASISRVQ